MRESAPLAAGIAGVGALGVLALATFAFVRCDTPGDGSSDPTAGTWFQVRPPPTAPEGTTCWVWKDGALDQSYGGPQCFPPTGG